MEKSYIMIKPDGVERRLIGEIVRRIEQKGFTINRAELIKPERKVVEEHYIEHAEKPFYKELVDYIVDGKVFAMEVEGEGVISVLRLMIGDKDPCKAQAGTIRGDFANSVQENIIHGSDGVDSAKRELALWFA